ncbi:MAG: hypothetical protein AB1779_08755 [Candidatus Thermoplasmatota archaeon]
MKKACSAIVLLLLFFSCMQAQSIYEDILRLENELEKKINQQGIMNETSRLDKIVGKEKEPIIIEPKICYSERPIIKESYIFEKAEKTEPTEGTTVIDFLLTEPMSYWVFTNYSGIEKWSKGYIRPTLEFKFIDGVFQFVNWEMWVYIDVDNDGKDEIRARLFPLIDDIQVNLPKIFPKTPGNIIIKGGLKIEIEKIVQESFKLEIFFLKSLNYTNYSYIWLVGFDFFALPINFSLYIKAENIKAEGGIGRFFDIIENLLKNATVPIENISIIKEINGPYTINIDSTKNLDTKIFVGYIKYHRNIKVEKASLEFFFSIAYAYDRIPENMDIFLDSPAYNYSFDKLKWNADIPAKLLMRYYASVGIYAETSIVHLPEYFYLDIERMDDTTNIFFESSKEIELLEFKEWEFLENGTNSTSVRIMNIPKLIYINGTISVGGAYPPPISNDVGISFISRFIDNLLVRIAFKFHMIGETLRSIPKNVATLPEKKGWFELFSPMENIEMIELNLNSGEYIFSSGNYVAFYNLSKPEQIRNLSICGALTNFSLFRLDFREGNKVEFRGKAKEMIEILFLDVPLNMKSSVKLSPLPPYLLLNATNNTLNLIADNVIEKVIYVCYYAEEYIEIEIEGVSRLSIYQDPNNLQINGTIEKFSFMLTNGTAYTIEGNHLVLLDKSEIFISFSVEKIESLSYSKGYKKFSWKIDTKDELKLKILKNNEIDLSAIISPIPKAIDLELPRILDVKLELPGFLNISGGNRMNKLILALTNLGEELKNGIFNVTKKLVDELGVIGTNNTISYNANSQIKIIAKLEKGKLDEKLNWHHGVSCVFKNGNVKANIYLQLPEKGYLKLNMGEESLDLKIDYKNYTSEFDYLLLDIKGIQKRDVFLYLEELPKTLSFDLSAFMKTEIGKEKISMNITMSAESGLKKIYLKMKRDDTFFKVFFSSTPKEINTKINFSNSIEVEHTGDTESGEAFFKLKRKVKEVWGEAYIVLSSLPSHLTLSIITKKEFDMDESPIVALPSINLDTYGSSIDIYAYIEKNVFGQQPNYELSLKDVGWVFCNVNAESYTIRADAKELDISIRALPYTKQYILDELKIYAGEVRSAQFALRTIFGQLPIIEIEKLECKELKVDIEHEIEIFGKRKSANVIFLDFSFGSLPKLKFFYNCFYAEGGGHILIPAYILTFILTFGTSPFLLLLIPSAYLLWLHRKKWGW